LEHNKLCTVGEKFSKTVRYTREAISHFAHLTFDDNPVHHSIQVARLARHGDIIAAGQQTSGIMMGMAATYFSRSSEGIHREMLCLNFNFSYKLPVFADQDLLLTWEVTATQWNGKLGGLVVQLEGNASARPGQPSVIGRGMVLVKQASAQESLGCGE
jgi:acyl dehydratase